MITDGQQDSFVREYGHKIFDHIIEITSMGEVFNQAMSSYFARQTTWVSDA